MVNKPKFQNFKKETSIKTFKIAEADLHAAKILASAPSCRPEIIVYHVQQSVEKSLKSVIIFLEKAVPLTHEIEILIEQLPENITQDFPSGANELTQYATVKRYTEGDELIEKKDLAAALSCADFFLNWARQIIFTT